MSENKSVTSGGFNFKADTENNKQDVAKDTKVEVMEKDNKTYQEELDETANQPYIDRRSVTIARVTNYSKYREANRTVLPDKVDHIGSSVRSSMTLSSNEDEVKAYFPALIGVSANHPDFVTSVKKYLNNFQVFVDGAGKTFDTSFHYRRKADYDMISAKEKAIEAIYDKVDKRDLSVVKRALAEKIKALNELESTKHIYGYPLKIADYLFYRHCLLYDDIAKDTSLINSDINIRFYFKDDQKEARIARVLRDNINKARANYVTLLGDEVKFEAIYVQYCVASNLPVISSLLKSDIDKDAELANFSEREPVKFNKMFNNPEAKLIGTIEHLIARGILMRSSYNQQITDTEGNVIGANMIETIAWFKSPENRSIVDSYTNTLNNI